MVKEKQVPWLIDKEKAVLLVIDMQNDFVLEGRKMEVPMAREQLPQMKLVLETCRKYGIPAVFTTHVLRDDFEISPLETTYQPWLKDGGMRLNTDGIEVVDELKPLPNEIVIQKHRYCAFYNTNLDIILRNIRGSFVVDTVIIIGTVTNICCENTARSAFMRDYKVAMIGDACGGFDEESHHATLKTIDRNFGRVLTTEQFIQEIEQSNTADVS